MASRAKKKILVKRFARVRMWGVRELKTASCELRAENCELPKNNKKNKKIIKIKK